MSASSDIAAGGPPEVSEAPAHRIARELREMIVGGELLPNERIKQASVAEQFGVSRLPVREALRELAAEGWITLERDVGARVAALDPNELIETFLMRETLEPLAVAESVKRIEPDALDRVRELCTESEAFATPELATDYLEIDRRFHAAIFEASAMPRLYATIQSLWHVAERYRRAYSILPHRLEISVVEHRMIVEAIEREASRDAAELHRIHIRRTRLTLSEHPELFPERAAAVGTERGEVPDDDSGEEGTR